MGKPSLSSRILVVLRQAEAYLGKLLDRLVEDCRKNRMKYPTRHCEICKKPLKRDQLDFSVKEYGKRLCIQCQKDEKRDKAMNWLRPDKDNGMWMYG